MTIEIAGRRVGPEEPTLIVAELSANHVGRYDVAKGIVRAASAAGADAVKFQTYTADSLTLDADGDEFRIGGGTPWDGRTLYELYESAAMPMEWHEPLAALAGELGLIWFSAPTDIAMSDFLEPLDPPAYKIASFEITDIAFIEHVASKGKPVILSTGVATLEDIESAVEACRRADNENVALLKCTSAYPAPLASMNLHTIPDLAERFGTVVGLSDHSTSLAVPAAAVALGARIVEKHLALDRALGGPDAAFSLEPEEFAAMARAVREAELALGEATYELDEVARRSRRFARSLFVARDVPAGAELTAEDVRSVRPSSGLHPGHLGEVLGRRAKAAIGRGTPLSWDLLEGGEPGPGGSESGA